MHGILAIDIGTSSISAGLSTDGGRTLVAAASRPNDASLPHVPPDGHEQDAERIWERCAEVSRAVQQEAGLPADAVALTGQMHGLLLADPETLMPATPLITWRDRRRAAPRDLEGRERTGCALHPGYGGLTLARILAEQPDLRGSATALAVTDFVAARLSGVVATDDTQAASWGLLDLQTRRPDQARLRLLGIPPDLLPPIRPSCGLLGKTTGARAREFGLRPGGRVYSPVGDNQASVAGAGGLEAGIGVINIGTGGQVSIPSPCARAAFPLEARPMPEIGFLHVGASLAAGWAYAYLKDFFRDVLHRLGNLTLPDEEIYARMNRLLREYAGPPADPPPPRWDTRFAGSREAPDRRSGIRDLDTHNLTTAALTAACVQGVVDELAGLVDDTDLSGIREFVVTGTAAQRIPGLVERIGRAFRRPVRGRNGEWDAVRGAARLVHRREKNRLSQPE